jgi:hypothetical protein
MQWSKRSAANSFAWTIVVIGVILAFSFGLNLQVLFVAFAIASLVGSFGTPNPKSVLGGLHAFTWLLAVAFFIASGSWTWLLVGGLVSILLGFLGRPIATFLYTMASDTSYVAPPNAYQPPPQPVQPEMSSPEAYYRPYQEGYQETPEHPMERKSSNEEAQTAVSPAQQYDQPQAQYPQQMPPS